MTRVGCRPPAVEVRCESLRVEADVFADQSRNLPSIINAYRDCFEVHNLPVVSFSFGLSRVGPFSMGVEVLRRLLDVGIAAVLI